MGRLWVLAVAMALLCGAAPALAEGPGASTEVMIPVVNRDRHTVVLNLDGTTTIPGKRYLKGDKSVGLRVVDPAREGTPKNHEHVLVVQRLDQGVEPWCRVKITTSNTVGRAGTRLTYCSAASHDDFCALQVYNDSQTCWVLVTVR